MSGSCRWRTSPPKHNQLGGKGGQFQFEGEVWHGCHVQLTMLESDYHFDTLPEKHSNWNLLLRHLVAEFYLVRLREYPSVEKSRRILLELDFCRYSRMYKAISIYCDIFQGRFYLAIAVIFTPRRLIIATALTYLAGDPSKLFIIY